MMKTCVFDAAGNLINIGPWDYQIQPFEVEPEERAMVEIAPEERNADGNVIREAVLEERVIKEAVYEDRVTNPLPEGAYEEEREVAYNADGGLVLADDYRTLRRSAYPQYSAWDVLDEVLKHITPEAGSALEQIQNERLAVKAAYPKPEVDA